MTGVERYSSKAKVSYNIGDIGPSGGLIFATPSTDGNTTGEYFEAAPYGWNSGADPSRTWAESAYQTTNVAGATGTVFGTGYANTLAIIAQGNTNTATSAAALAQSYRGGGFSDWFLPSFNELTQLVQVLFVDNGNIANLVENTSGVVNYWSSTQETNNIYLNAPARALSWMYFGDVGPEKSDLFSVRPVRMFSVTSSSSVQRSGNDSAYGSGQDGTVVIASNISLTRDMYYSNLTINSGSHLNTNGFKVFVKNKLTVNGSIGITSAQSVSTGTLAGRLAVGSGNTSVSIGGNSGGNTFTASQLTASDRSNLEFLISGIAFNSSGVITSIKGGAAGVAGANGTVTAGGAGSPGTLSRNALVPGGPGSPGTAPPASAGGAGGAGGAVVLIVAKQVIGSGVILSQGQNANVGASSSTGNVGNTAPTATLTHLVDGSAHYRTGDGTTGPHASVTAPNVPHGTHFPYTQNRLHGHTYRHVHTGNNHHTNNNVFGAYHNNHGEQAPITNPHHYGDFNDTPHVDTLTSTYFAISGIPHNTGHRNHTGIAFTFTYTHYSGAFNSTNDTQHFTRHWPAQHDGKYHIPASHEHVGYPRHHVDNNHSHFRARNAGTVSTQGSNPYPGGAGGAAGSSTAGSSGITGGGGGIIVITDLIANTVTTSTVGGTVSGGGTGQSGTVLTILNQ
jgi:hypothetical protein